MKYAKLILTTLLAATTVVANPVWAGGYHHGHGYGHGHGHAGVGVYFGAPLWPWAWYYPPSYYYPPAVSVPAEPPPAAYVEQAAPTQNYWYHCANPEGYYPYVKECPNGWQQVSPHP